MEYSRTLLLLLSVLCSIPCFSQKEVPADYAQKLKGSELVIDMISIPAGNFRMGSSTLEENRNEDEGPTHTVQIDAFWMSKYEVTWELYNLYINRNIDAVFNKVKGSEVELAVDAVAGATVPYVDMSLGMGTEAGLPVGNVTQLAASTFCKWLSAKTGYFYRLPTEAEWEYAARAGTTTAYHFGDDTTHLDTYAWHYENSDNTYHTIGQKKPNPWGLYDMYGNVAEWTLDQYIPEAYQKRGKTSMNPWEVATTEYPRAVRGGSYDDDAKTLRSAARTPSKERWKMRDPQFPKSKWWNTDAPFVGFRLVRHAATPTTAEMKKYWNQEL